MFFLNDEERDDQDLDEEEDADLDDENSDDDEEPDDEDSEDENDSDDSEEDGDDDDEESTKSEKSGDDSKGKSRKNRDNANRRRSSKNRNTSEQRKTESRLDEIEKQQRKTALLERKRTFGYENDLSPKQVDLVFRMTKRPTAKFLQRPEVAAALGAIKSQESVSKNTASNTGRTYKNDKGKEKGWTELKPEERQSRFADRRKAILERKRG